jgi:hypothetical protein
MRRPPRSTAGAGRLADVEQAPDVPGSLAAMDVHVCLGPAGHGSGTGLHGGPDRPLLARTERADAAARMCIRRLGSRRLRLLLGRRGNGGRRGRGRGRISSRSRGLHRARVGGGQEQLRVDVALWVPGLTDAEVDIRHRQLRNATRVDRANRFAFPDDRPAPDREGAEVHERHGIPVRRLDRHRLAGSRHGSSERDGPRGRRDDGRPHRRTDVEPAVLSRRVRVRAVERERRQDGPGHRPAPGQCRSGRGQGGGESGHEEK